VTERNRKKEAEKELDGLRDLLLPYLRAGGEVGPDSPYSLHLVRQERRTVDWAQVALELATKLLGDEKRAVAHLGSLLADEEPSIVEIIQVVPNSAYDALAAQGKVRRT
jgi:hypothetical protein